jgi:Transposase IS200 like.
MAHTLTNLLFHVIFGTKGREPSIDAEVRAPFHAYLGGIVRELNGIAIVVNGTDDHVHALVKREESRCLRSAVTASFAAPRLAFV